MRNLKRVLSLALACVMVIGMMVMTTGAADFTDADEIKNVEAVEVMTNIGIIGGYNGKFDPNGTLTRGQAAKIIAYMLLGPTTAEKLVGSGAFTDTVGHWADPYISYCSNLKIVGGYGNGKFGPDDALTDLQFGKMVMVALGEDSSKFVGDSWATVTGAAMIEMGLVRTATGTNISRDDACALALAGLKKGIDIVTYDVEIGEDVISFDNQNDALLYCAINDEAEFLGKQVTTVASLLEEVYHITAAVGIDAFGRTSNVYTEIGEDEPMMVFNTQAPAKVYTDKVLAKTVAADLSGYKADGFKVNNTYEIEDDTLNITVLVGGEGDPIAATSGTVAAAIADVTGDNKTVEIYANAKKEITKIVVVQYGYDYIAKVTKADADKDIEASVELGVCGATFKTDAFAEGDIVIFTYADGEVQTLALAESFTGTMTTYNKDGEFTIDGEVYEVASNGGVNGFDEDDVIAKMGKEQVYYVGQNGKLIYCEDPAGTAPVVITDYVLITDSKVKTTRTEWPAPGAVTASTAQVKGILSDGTEGVFDLAVAKAAKGDNKGHFVTKINNTEYVVETNDAAVKDTNDNNINGIYTYTLDGSTITLVKKLAALNNDDEKNVVETTAVEKLTASTAESNGVIFNSETVFILKNAQNKVVVKTGIAALEGTPDVDGTAVVNVSYNAKAPEGQRYTNVAAVVFARDVLFVAAPSAVDTDDFIYVDGTYVVTADAEGEKTYTYTGVKADGSKISVTGDADLDAGVYNYNAKKEIVDVDGDALAAANTAIVADAEVGTIAGTSVKLGDTFRTVDASAKVVVVAKDAALVKGATVTYVYNTDTNVVALVYVTAAAE